MKVQKSVTKKVVCVNKGQGTVASTKASDHVSFHIAGRKRWRRKREEEREKKNRETEVGRQDRKQQIEEGVGEGMAESQGQRKTVYSCKGTELPQSEVLMSPLKFRFNSANGHVYLFNLHKLHRSKEEADVAGQHSCRNY